MSDYVAKPCVRSGACCKASPCGFGHWNEEKTQCAHLVGDEPGNYSCGIYSEIIKNPTAHISPAFGAGCCRTLFNEDREKVLAQLL